MKCIDRNSVKTVKITSNDTDSTHIFWYWGVEWSHREFMITYVNSARGSYHSLPAIYLSHNPHDVVQNNKYILKHQDNEIWDFNPDLLIIESLIHNDSAGNVTQYGTIKSNAWKYYTYDMIFNTDNNISLKSRASILSKTFPECVIFNGMFGIANPNNVMDGHLGYATSSDGVSLSVSDVFSRSLQLVKTQEHTIAVNTEKYWEDAIQHMYNGDFVKALTRSSRNGDNPFNPESLTYDGTHLNDLGSRVIAKCLSNIFNFYII